MGDRVSSPVLVGRRAELETLRRALATITSGSGAVITVAGEAGVGKSRLLNELIGSVALDPPGARPFIAASATAVEIAAGELSYAPLVELLERLQPDLAAPTALEARALATALTGTEPAGPATSLADAGASRTRQLVRLHALIADIATDRDVLLVFDDLQWADRSTLDAIAYLANRLIGEPVTILLAYRSDDLHRRHPLRPWLGEIRRHASRLHLDLEPLSSEAVIEQIDAIIGERPSNELMRAVVQRAEGNPFLVEELVALGRPAGLPESLRDVLLSRLAPLGPATMALLRAAAIIGRDADRDLLEAVTGWSGSEFDDALRGAIDARIIVVEPDPERYRFRHALQREAIQDDALPTEQRRMHRRAAEALAARDGPRRGSSVAEIAHHWAAAQVPDAAFTAYIEAAAAAESASAWAESAVSLDRALGLWDIVEPATRAGQDRVDLLRRAGWAMEVVGESRRALGLLEEAISLVDEPTDHDRLAHLCIDASYVAADLADGRASELIARAVELTDGERSAVRARALSFSAGGRAITGRYREALEQADAALAIADEAHEPSARFAAHSAREMALANLGHPDESEHAFAAALNACREAHQPDARVIVLLNHLAPRLIAGRIDEGRDLIDQALAESRRLGVDVEIWCEVARAELEWLAGRLPEAQAAIERAGTMRLDGQPGESHWLTRARIGAWQGRPDEVRLALGAAATLAGSGPFAPWSIASAALIRAEDAAWRSDARAARLHADEGLAALAPTDELAVRSSLLAAAARAVADEMVAARARREPGHGDGSAYRHLAAAIRSGDLVPGSNLPASAIPFLDLVEAEAAREMGGADPAAWAVPVEGLERVGLRPLVAYARYRLGEALLEAGDRVAAVAPLAKALQAAVVLGARPLQEQVADLARRARLDLAAAEPSDSAALPERTARGRVTASQAADPWGLSEREREVLDLVAQGWTNRRIGEALFISPKTASVHVTHILDKLGVSSRTEAALLAGRAGIGNTDGPSEPDR